LRSQIPVVMKKGNRAKKAIYSETGRKGDRKKTIPTGGLDDEQTPENPISMKQKKSKMIDKISILLKKNESGFISRKKYHARR